jgi:hypothetical protein
MILITVLASQRDGIDGLLLAAEHKKTLALDRTSVFSKTDT